MRLVMTLLVRDEADVVRENLDFHFAQGVDFAIVMDNRSSDGTTEILREYEARGRVRLLAQPGLYHQAPWLTEMARLAADEEGADWVLPNDADEFWMSAEGSLREVLMDASPEVGAFACRRVNFYPAPEDGRPWWQRMTLRQRLPVSKRGLPFNAKLIHRAHPRLELTKGNHQRAQSAVGATVKLETVEVLHFQMRTYRQFERGVVVRGSTLKGASAPKQRFNRSRRVEYRLWREGRLGEYYGRFLKKGPDDETLEDTRLRDRLAALYEGGPAHPPQPARASLRAALPRARARAGAIPARARSSASRLRNGAPPAPAPFVVGVPRSGTTLMRLMLDAHPRLAIPAETHFLPLLVRRWRRLERAGAPASERVEACLEIITSHPRWGDLEVERNALEEHLAALRDPRLADVARAVHVVHAHSRGKDRWGDKSPSYVRRVRQVARILPEARFVHVIRDGRDVALSLTGVSWGPDDLEVAAGVWRQRIRVARRQASTLAPHTYTEVHYEQLVSDPEPVLRRITRFLDLPWDPAVLRSHEGAAARMAPLMHAVERPDGRTTSAEDRERQHALLRERLRPDRVGRWRAEMGSADRERIEGVVGELLEELGYPIESDPRS